MRLVDQLLQTVARLTRALPDVRGLGRLYRMFNRLALQIGVEPQVVAPMRDGTTLRLDLRTQTDLNAYYRGRYDPVLMNTVVSLLDPSTVFLDVGANVGYYSVAIAAWFRAHGNQGRVVAFEPFEGNFVRLCENLADNALQAICSAHKVGLSDVAADSLITLREDFRLGAGTGNASIPTDAAFDAGFRTVPIRLEPLDSFWPQHYATAGRIDMIKVDIEGHEDYCLRGARQTLAQHRPTILMEVNRPFYDVRRVELDATFLPLLPAAYGIYRLNHGIWQRIETLTVCSTIDNVLLVPDEKLSLPCYAVFS